MKIYVVGIGPGGKDDLTPRAKQAIEDSDLILGYRTYIQLIAGLFPGKPFLVSGMQQEVARCRVALEKALSGQKVALISGGDSGIYGMAGIMLEVVANSRREIPVEIIPGITAASAAAAVVGAPLMHDFAVISLSDRLTPWETIQKRIEYAARGDYVVCFYNPRSSLRTEQIVAAREILLRFQAATTPVSIVRNVSRVGEDAVLTTLEKMLAYPIDMFTVIIVGNSQTYIAAGRMITPRGYHLSESEQ